MRLETDASGSSARLAILFSAAICPGAGHFVQRRRLAGVIYCAAFVACLVMMFLAVILPMAINMRLTLDFMEKGGTAPFRNISVAKVLIWFGLALLVYSAALADVVIYARRQVRRQLSAHRSD